MQTEIFSDPDVMARRGAALIADAARSAVAGRGRFVVAFSGGRTPWGMLRALAEQQLPWDRVQLFQVDERVAPAGDPDRNMAHIRESLLSRVPLRPDQVHPMPVEDSNLDAAAARYAAELRAAAGDPPVIDLVHLGIGADGHTASLVPGDPVLDVTDRDVAISGPYEGRKRMTLTYPILDRARRILWYVMGAGRAAALAKLRAGDRSIPAGRVNQGRAILLADTAAAG